MSKFQQEVLRLVGRQRRQVIAQDKVSMVEENNVRQGFLEHGNFLKLLSKLPDHVQPLVEPL
jgi:hypothetical protein